LSRTLPPPLLECNPLFEWILTFDFRSANEEIVTSLLEGGAFPDETSMYQQSEQTYFYF
jgi:hypothetical protein